MSVCFLDNSHSTCYLYFFLSVPRSCCDNATGAQAFCNIASSMPTGIKLVLCIIFYADLHFSFLSFYKASELTTEMIGGLCWSEGFREAQKPSTG